MRFRWTGGRNSWIDRRRWGIEVETFQLLPSYFTYFFVLVSLFLFLDFNFLLNESKNHKTVMSCKDHMSCKSSLKKDSSFTHLGLIVSPLWYIKKDILKSQWGPVLLRTLLNIFCVLQKKENKTGLERHKWRQNFFIFV